MTLPIGTRKFSMAVKYYLASYRVCADVRYAIATMSNDDLAFSSWKVQWAGICSLLKTAVHLMKLDAKRCFSVELRGAMHAAWQDLGNRRSEHAIFWEFVNKERNNILKEYEFSAYEGFINEDGSIDWTTSILSMVDKDRGLFIRGGPYGGRRALEVASEAADWLEHYIVSAIVAAGYDPDEKIESDGMLYRRVSPLSQAGDQTK